ncbi:MAG: cation transporter [Clostridia bacterium]|nr:cation transporter [Clostridia bacterium]
MRDRTIRKFALIGLAVNLGLALVKAIVGMRSQSIAVTGDAANNLSDAFGSAVILLSAYIAGKPEDREHPYGHGRMEYISALAVGFLIFMMALEVLRSSLASIRAPEEKSISPVLIITLLCSVLVKVTLFFMQRHAGRKLESLSLQAESRDSLSDAVVTFFLLLGLVAGALAHWPLDGWLGLAAGVMVLWEGISVLRESGNRLLGGTPNPDIGRRIVEILSAFPEVLGVHDLQLHDYGPGRTIAIVDVETEGEKTVREMHAVIDQAEQQIRRELGITICIHADPVDETDPKEREMHIRLEQRAWEIERMSHVHDIHIEKENGEVRVSFDVSIPTDSHSGPRMKEALSGIVREYYPECTVFVHLDLDYFSEVAENTREHLP